MTLYCLLNSEFLIRFALCSWYVIGYNMHIIKVKFIDVPNDSFLQLYLLNLLNKYA